MKKVFKFIFSKEIIFVLFLYAGFFKEAISFPIDLTVLFMVMSMMSVLKSLIKGKNLYKIQIEAIVLFWLMAVLVGISIFYSPAELAYEKGFRFIIITGWSFLGALFIINSKYSLKRFFKGFISLGLITSIFAVKEYLTGEQVGSVMVFESDYLALGRVVGTAAIIVFCNLVLRKMKLIPRLFGYSILLMMLVAIVVSGGRGPFLFLLIVFCFFALFNIRLTKGYIFLTVITLGTSLFISKSKLDIFDTLLIRIGHALNQRGGGASISGRTDRFNTALQMFNDKPLFGYGIEGFTQVYNTGRIEYPHNIFLEFASELGLIGLILFIAMLFLALFRFLNVFNKIADDELKILAWITLSLFLFHFANSNVSGSLLGNRVLFTFIGLLWVFKHINIAAIYPNNKEIDLKRAG